MRYPPTPVHPVVYDYLGAKVTDPYPWLENGSDPAVEQWAQAQTALARTTIEGAVNYSRYARRVAALNRTSTIRFNLVLAGGRAVYLRQTPPQPHAVLVARDGLKAPERVLFDPQSAAIESVFVAPDGAKVAFTTQSGGDEIETLHVVDAATGELLADTLPHAGGETSPSAVGWDAGDGGFVYARWPQPPRRQPHYRRPSIRALAPRARDRRARRTPTTSLAAGSLRRRSTHSNRRATAGRSPRSSRTATASTRRCTCGPPAAVRVLRKSPHPPTGSDRARKPAGTSSATVSPSCR